MKPWEVIGRARTPDGTELVLSRHEASGYLITANGEGLMSSRIHGSEQALAVLGCARASTLAGPRVLVGGLGMGFTLRAALNVLPADAEVLVSELVPEVVEWNRGELGGLAQHPMADPRVRVDVGDVVVTLRSNPAGFDAVLLDVDNGPSAMSDAANGRLYGSHGLVRAREALRPGGVLAVWSATGDRGFERRLHAAGFSVRAEAARSRQKSGARHTVWVATAPGA